MLNFEKIKIYEPIIIIGHQCSDLDSLISCFFLSKLFSFKGIKNEIRFQDNYREWELKYSGIDYSDIKTGFSNSDNLFLVDHVFNYKNNVVGCIDHHPNAHSIPFGENFIEREQSSCAKIIFDIMIEEGMEETKDLVYKTIMSIYGDTLSLKLKSKVIPSDLIWIKDKIKQYGFNESEFLPSGLRLTNLNAPLSEIVKNKFKTINFADKLINTSIVCVEYMIDSNFLHNITEEIRNECIKFDSYFWILVILCLKDEQSVVCQVFQDGRLKIKYFNRIVSRGRDILPRFK